ncbi:microtubule-associated-like protein [Heliothis zea nudivirus]|uniref:Microtubule-associated-like protein n=1 Tax=Heliothis zea nudivirus 1 TaxID=3116536 RepID=Q8JKJ1_9VIRU|nr:microtubule-associated-like protein [Heliothis zea nudivirus]AAN04415.1 microtubule-associated-like protein [Heliothis zea nudivirus]
MNQIKLANANLYKKAALMSWLERDRIACDYVKRYGTEIDVDALKGLFDFASQLKLESILVSVGKSVVRSGSIGVINFLTKIGIGIDAVLDPTKIDPHLDDDDMISLIEHRIEKLSTRETKKHSIYYNVTMKMFGQMLNLNLEKINQSIFKNVDESVLDKLSEVTFDTTNENINLDQLKPKTDQELRLMEEPTVVELDNDNTGSHPSYDVSTNEVEYHESEFEPLPDRFGRYRRSVVEDSVEEGFSGGLEDGLKEGFEDSFIRTENGNLRIDDGFLRTENDGLRTDDGLGSATESSVKDGSLEGLDTSKSIDLLNSLDSSKPTDSSITLDSAKSLNSPENRLEPPTALELESSPKSLPVEELQESVKELASPVDASLQSNAIQSNAMDVDFEDDTSGAPLSTESMNPKNVEPTSISPEPDTDTDTDGSNDLAKLDILNTIEEYKTKQTSRKRKATTAPSKNEWLFKTLNEDDSRPDSTFNLFDESNGELSGLAQEPPPDKLDSAIMGSTKATAIMDADSQSMDEPPATMNRLPKSILKRTLEMGSEHVTKKSKSTRSVQFAKTNTEFDVLNNIKPFIKAKQGKNQQQQLNLSALGLSTVL